MNHTETHPRPDEPRSKTPYTSAPTRANVTLNREQSLYVIPSGDGYTCLGFENARANAQQIATALGDPSLEFAENDFGEISGHDKYQRAIHAWCQSNRSSQTYFDPGTPDAVRRLLERYRVSGATVRVVMGDPDTGCDWLEEHDVLGTIGRSTGPMRVPLLIEPGERGGMAILTRCIVRIIDWDSQREVYVHPGYTVPAMVIAPEEEPADARWPVTVDGQVHARFKDYGQAASYVGFMRGLSVDPKCFR